MNYLEFRNKWINFACFNTNQIYAWYPGFDRNNLTRWLKKGFLVRLKQGLYTFYEYNHKADFPFYFANQIYKPSYISLHTALSFYGLIPEAVVQITSITTLKTAMFKNEFGEYTYKKVKNDLLFGYEMKPIHDGMAVKFATAEKALLDLLYIYPFYNTENDMHELRLDEEFIHDDLDLNLMKMYSDRFKSKALENRLSKLINAYDL